MTRNAFQSRRTRASCSMLALATVLAVGASPAAAQSFQGTGSFTHGTGAITTPDSVTTNISVTSPQAVIDWAPFNDEGATGDPFVFQAGGTTATFSSASDFAVLNNVNIADFSRVVEMHGTINSMVGQAPGGSLYFYSPSGFVLGATSVINVGSLVLTASPLQLDGNGNFINGTSVTFNQAPTPGASIRAMPGSQINALNEGSYVAMVAPRVHHLGGMNVNGSVALVGAEAATINFSPDGLFDIAVTTGTTDANGVAAYGDITGPASSGTGDNHRVYMVAVPKNTALTMVIGSGGDIGFNIAGAADVVGNTVVLSAGHDVVDGAAAGVSAASGAAANLAIQNNSFTSAVVGHATGTSELFAFNPLTAASDVTLHSVGLNRVTAQTGSSLTIAGNLTMSTDVTAAAEGQSITAASAQIHALGGGTITINGDVNISANATGADSGTSGVAAGNGTGGQVDVLALSGGSLSIGGNIIASADGFGGGADAAGVNAGDGFGGFVDIGTSGDNASFSVTGTTTASADGHGGDGGGLFRDCSGCNGLGGIGDGGEVTLGKTLSTSSTAFFGNNVELHADGYGGSSGAPGSASADGLGGYVFVVSDGANVETLGLEITGGLTASAIGYGGASFSPGIAAGLGQGGEVYISAWQSGTMAIRGALDADASGIGGDLDSGVSGGDGIGGLVTMDVADGNALIEVDGAAVLTANGEASSHIECIGCGAVGGDGVGGTVEMLGLAGTGNIIDFGSTLRMEAEGYGGEGVTSVGGLGQGGTAQINATTGLTVNVASTLWVEADGYGGYGYNGNGGGAGLGGFAEILVSGGTFDANGDVFLDAGGAGGNTGIIAGGNGGAGTGGEAQLLVTGGSADIAGSLFAEAFGEGGDSAGATGGFGSGGLAEVRGDGGSVTIGGSAFLHGEGMGGTGASGGGALGGNAILAADNGGSVTVIGMARVRSNASAASGADGQGGTTTISADGGGQVSLGTLNASADGRGGNDAGSGAGDGFGGTTTLAANGAGSSVSVTNSITAGNMQDREILSADGFGGTTFGGGDATGGNATGGTLNLSATAGGSVSLAPSAVGTSELLMRARGYGGSADAEGTTGGDATGGIINLNVDGGTMTAGQTQLSSYAQGGNSISLTGLNINGGDGTGGERHISVVNGGTLTIALPGGVAGGSGGEATGTGNAGNGSGGLATLTVDNSTVNFTGNSIIVSQNSGGATFASGNGGHATGGQVTTVNITNGSVINIAAGATLGIGASGHGGFTEGGTGGTAVGGNVNATISNSTINGGTLELYATGSGADGFIGGGNGTGGNATLTFNNSTFNGQQLSVDASAAGGWSETGTAGNGTGGTARLENVGGTSVITASGGPVQVLASGFGGSIMGGSGAAGDGNGGIAGVNASGGSLGINGGVTVEAGGVGGDAAGGIGGDGTGRLAYVEANGGDITIGGTATIDASGIGGDGNSGGHGTGGGDPVEFLDGAHLGAHNGDIIVNGSVNIASTGTGGAGANGGIGGDGVGGWLTVVSFNDDLGPSSITVQGVESGLFASTDGVGGAGGQGTTGGTGGAGGAGGGGAGGSITVVANAGNGEINIPVLDVSATGTGGVGGSGGNGDLAPGGIGGAGGIAYGGSIEVGTSSGNEWGALATNDGSATFGSIAMDASATGGAGGAGGDDGNATFANGGAGGNAEGGGTTLLVRGSTVNVEFVDMVANATGGNGGAGGTAGVGGNATIGTNQGYDFIGPVGVLVTDRFETPTQRGTLNAGTINGSATATAGFGSTNGVSLGVGGSEFEVRNADATIDSVDIQISAATSDPAYMPDRISIIDGDVTVTGDFSFVTSGNMSVLIDNGSLTAGNLVLSATNFVDDIVTGTPAAMGTISAATADITTGQDIVLAANLDIGSGFSLSAPDLIDIGDINTAGNLQLAAATILAGNLTAGGFIDLFAGGLATIDVGDLSGDGVYLTSPGNITTGNIVSTLDVDLESVNGSITTLDVTADSDIVADAGGGIDMGDLAAGTQTIEGFSPGDVVLTAGGPVNTGAITALGNVNLDSGAGISTGNIDALDAIILSAATGIAAGNITADSLTADTLSGNMAFGDIAILFGLFLNAPGSITTGMINTDDFVFLQAVGGITTEDIDAATFVEMFAGSNIATGAILAGNSISLVSTDGSIGTGALTTLTPPPPPQLIDGIGAQSHVAGASVSVEAAGNVSTGAISSYDGVYVEAGGGIGTGAVDAGDFVEMLAGGGIGTGDIDSGAGIDLEAGGDIGFGNLTAGEDVDISSGGAITGGNIVAGFSVFAEAEGAVVLGDITGGPQEPEDTDTFSVGVVSGTSITVGDVQGVNRVGFATLGDLIAGNVQSGWDVMALVGGNATFGSITTGEGDQVYIANASMCSDGGGCAADDDGDFQPEDVLALDPVATGGSITINGDVNTSLFRAAAGTDLTTGAITAPTIEASAGGTASINGLWSAGEATLASNDIAIGEAGGISASGLVTLVSTNATQMLIGDGLTGSGYALSNAEFGRVEGGSVYLLGRGDASAGIDMLVGDLTVTGPSAGSTIESSDGILVFGVGDAETLEPGGVIRVTGNVGATGFGAGNAIEFHSDRFELDAATGSISITSSGGTLAGELGLYADQIHVAEGAVLDQLAADPQYSGYLDDLNAPASVQRPEGVLNAGVIWIESDNLQSILIQNTGTAQTPAGFTANEIFVNDAFDSAGPAGSIDVVANGQLVTESGTLTGVAVRDALVEGEDLTPFTPTSTINGCELTGGCGSFFEEQPPPGVEVVPGQIDLIASDPLGETDFGNEPDIAVGEESEEGEESEADSPIEAPQPLFDTRPLNDAGEVDDPVSGTGNPSLIGGQSEGADSANGDDEGEGE